MLLGIGLLVIGVVWWLRPPANSFRKFELIEVGHKLEKIELQPLLGPVEPIQSSDLTGQVVLLNFWGPWCPPCRIELPHLMEMQERLQKHQDFRFI